MFTRVLQLAALLLCCSSLLCEAMLKRKRENGVLSMLQSIENYIGDDPVPAAVNKDDITRIERVTDSTSARMKDLQTDIDERLRQVSDLTRETEKDVRDTMRNVENRIEADMEKLESDLEEKLQKALDNPLAD